MAVLAREARLRLLAAPRLRSLRREERLPLRKKRRWRAPGPLARTLPRRPPHLRERGRRLLERLRRRLLERLELDPLELRPRSRPIAAAAGSIDKACLHVCLGRTTA